MLGLGPLGGEPVGAPLVSSSSATLSTHGIGQYVSASVTLSIGTAALVGQGSGVWRGNAEIGVTFAMVGQSALTATGEATASATAKMTGAARAAFPGVAILPTVDPDFLGAAWWTQIHATASAGAAETTPNDFLNAAWWRSIH